MIETIPLALLTQKDTKDQVISKVVLDLTLYLIGPSLNEFEYLINLYARVCPSNRLKRYTITELEFWPDISDPILTASGRTAFQEGATHPYFEPIRHRIKDGRSFDAQFWDGKDINEIEGSWSFSCKRIHSRSTGLHSFVRFTLPIQSNFEILRTLADDILDNVDIYSGHGGISFIYDPCQRETAFDRIYVMAKRYWGIDIEYLNSTLPLMNRAIKGVSWITIIGNKLLVDKSKDRVIESIDQEPNIHIKSRKKGVIFVIGESPTIGDERKIDDSNLNSYFKLSSDLKTLFPTHHSDFPGTLFFENGNTDGWIRRFLEPKGWSGRNRS